MTDIKKVFKDLYRYQWVYLLRGLILQILVGTVGGYLLSEVFYLVLLLAREDQLTQTNLLSLLKSPWAVLGCIGYLLLLSALIYIEYSLLVDIIRRKDRAISWSFRRFMRRCRDFLKTISGFQILFFLGYIILTMPLVQWLLSSTLLDGVRIPYFITDELLKQPKTALPLIIGGIGLYYINLRLIYTLPLTIVRFQTRFWDNLTASWQLTKGKSWQLLITLSLLALPLAFLAALILTLFFFFIELTGTGLLSKSLQWLLVTFIWGASLALTMMSKLTILSYLLTQLEKHHLHTSYEDLPKIPRRRRWVALTLIFLIGLSQFVVNYDRLSYNPYNKAIETIAHRGDVNKGVENSIEALVGAAEAQVDYVEMDIILSKDKQFIVSHDNDLRRLTGQSISISDSTAKELVGLPISQDDFKSQLVDFDTYVAKAKELNTKLMVELKPYGKEQADYAQLIVETFKRLGITKDYKLMSLDWDLIRSIEILAPEIETGYIIPLQFGYLAGEGVDFLLIEDFSYRDRLVWEARWRQQELYVWTINREAQMQHYLQTPIAGMITDHPELVNDTKKDLEKNNQFVDRLLRLLN
ncbi:glycerophosphoryl diester phosphodiesterase membrane domain-containing protein [Streptococcus sp. E17BB]|uniref:glycerophosphoryl diester phosphodiesterase membrane domain-containing protein n=1 Tax=Streptococcus sp. E17BB TaxID=3278714 RepID=UPI00359E7482